jgi:hypothetical protein
MTMSGKTTPGRSDRRSAKDLLDQAQDLIYDAWELADPIKRTRLARKALKISADCADAYVLLAEAAITLPGALEFYRQGVEAGERAWGRESFEENVGHFWGSSKPAPTCAPAPAWPNACGITQDTMRRWITGATY